MIMETRNTTKGDEMNNAHESMGLTVGTEIFYTGDAANPSAPGVIVATGSDRWGDFVDIEYGTDSHGEQRDPSRRLPICQFNPGPGTRFLLKSQCDESALGW